MSNFEEKMHYSGIYVPTPVSGACAFFPPLYCRQRLLCDSLGEEQKLKRGARRMRVSANIVLAGTKTFPCQNRLVICSESDWFHALNTP